MVVAGDERQLEEKSISSPGLHSHCLLGQLTDTGKSALSGLGESLHKKYFKTLGFSVDAHEIHLRSTNFPRTIESLQCLLHGLLPFLKDNSSDKSLKAVMVSVQDEYIETMYGSSRCAKFRQLLSKYAEKFAKDSAEEVRRLKENLPSVFLQKDPFGNLPSVFGIYDTLICRKEHGLQLPDGINELTLAKLERLAFNEWFGIFEESTEAVKFAIGRFFRELDSNFYRRDRKLCVYSGHDSTIAPIVSIFEGGLSKKTPPFAAHIVFELFDTVNRSSQSDEKFVRVIYNGQPMILPRCKDPENHYESDPSICKLTEFSLALKEYMPRNYIAECNNLST